MLTTEKPTRSNAIDLTGLRTGKLVVTEFAERRKNHGYWECLCDCGTACIVRGSHLKSGQVSHCGCQGRNRTHGHASHGHKTPTYNSWLAMIKRCENAAHKAFHNYGGRGITICDQWRNSFEAFLEDAGERPSPKHSIDRFPNKDGNYEPGNVRWATRTEQGNNRRGNVLLEFYGVTKTVMEWSRISQVAHSTIGRRLRAGYSPQMAVWLPVGIRGNS